MLAGAAAIQSVVRSDICPPMWYQKVALAHCVRHHRPAKHIEWDFDVIECADGLKITVGWLCKNRVTSGRANMVSKQVACQGDGQRSLSKAKLANVMTGRQSLTLW